MPPIGIHFFLTHASGAWQPPHTSQRFVATSVTDLFQVAVEADGTVSASPSGPVVVGRLSPALRWTLGQDRRVSRNLLRFTMEARPPQPLLTHERSVLVEATPSCSSVQKAGLCIPRVVLEVSDEACESSRHRRRRRRSPTVQVVQGEERRTTSCVPDVAEKDRALPRGAHQQKNVRQYHLHLGDHIIIQGVALELAAFYVEPTNTNDQIAVGNTTSSIIGTLPHSLEELSVRRVQQRATSLSSPLVYRIPLAPCAWGRADKLERHTWQAHTWRLCREHDLPGSARTTVTEPEESHRESAPSTGAAEVVDSSASPVSTDDDSALVPIPDAEAATPSQAIRRLLTDEKDAAPSRKRPREQGDGTSELLGVPQDPLCSVTPEPSFRGSTGETMDPGFVEKLDELLGFLGAQSESHPTIHRSGHGSNSPRSMQHNTAELTQNMFGYDYSKMPQESVDIYYRD